MILDAAALGTDMYLGDISVDAVCAARQRTFRDGSVALSWRTFNGQFFQPRCAQASQSRKALGLPLPAWLSRGENATIDLRDRHSGPPVGPRSGAAGASGDFGCVFL